MLEEQEVAEFIAATIESVTGPFADDDTPEYRDAKVGTVPSEGSFTLTLLDDTKFLVTVVKIEEA